VHKVTFVVHKVKERWAHGLEVMAERIKGCFPRVEPRQHATAYLRGLISLIERRNGWQLAEETGDSFDIIS
jgi:hypothetical protein